MVSHSPEHIKTIEQFHRFRSLPGPVHPLVSVVRFEDMQYLSNGASSWVLNFYAIAIKRKFHSRLKYGQQVYDFDNGVMTFMAPGQKIGIDAESNIILEHSGWLLLIHEDFLWKTPLAKGIRKYEFFNYSVHEALFLSEQEEMTLEAIIKNIKMEYERSIDSFTQNIILAQLEVLLAYAERFYKRQFITRKIANHGVLEELESLLNQSFSKENLLTNGLPTVQSVANALHISPNYLSGLLKTLTGKSTQEHIQDKLITHAKELLSTTNLSINEVAYSLGYTYPQTFSKLFRIKTAYSPAEFRKSFN
jgi:AraC family transcriptional activator of pobA